MDYFLEEIFKTAIEKEFAASKFYSDLSERIENKSIKNVLLKLSQDENSHAELLKKFDLSLVQKANKSIDLNDLTSETTLILDDSTDNTVAEFFRLLNYAIKKEQDASNYYQKLSSVLPSGKLKDDVCELISMENIHKIKLQKIVMKLKILLKKKNLRRDDKLFL
jgi:rubrerythrin